MGFATNQPLLLTSAFSLSIPLLLLVYHHTVCTHTPAAYSAWCRCKGNCYPLYNSARSGCKCACVHLCTVPRWSEYLRIQAYSDRGAVCLCPSMYYMYLDGQSTLGSWDLEILWRGEVQCPHQCTVPGSSGYLWILRYSDKVLQCALLCTVRGWSEYLGISGYSDRGVQCACGHPCTVSGWSDYLRISGYSDRGVQCACAHPCTVPGWSKYLGISGYSDKEVGVIFSNKCCHDNCLHIVYLKNGTVSLHGHVWKTNWLLVKV